jgi:hypothetical protein
MIHNTTAQTFDNTTIVEFLAANQPDLIKQWHAHTGINALKQLAEEYGEKPAPEPEYPLIDERLVFEFMDFLIFNTQEFTFDTTDPDSAHGTTEFWQKPRAEIFEHLTSHYEAIKSHHTGNNPFWFGDGVGFKNQDYYPDRLKTAEVLK